MSVTLVYYVSVAQVITEPIFNFALCNARLVSVFNLLNTNDTDLENRVGLNA